MRPRAADLLLELTKAGPSCRHARARPCTLASFGPLAGMCGGWRTRWVCTASGLGWAPAVTPSWLSPWSFLWRRPSRPDARLAGQLAAAALQAIRTAAQSAIVHARLCQQRQPLDGPIRQPHLSAPCNQHSFRLRTAHTMHEPACNALCAPVLAVHSPARSSPVFVPAPTLFPFFALLAFPSFFSKHFHLPCCLP